LLSGKRRCISLPRISRETQMSGRRSVLIASVLGLAGYAASAFGQATDTVKLREELMTLEKASWGFMRERNLEGMKNYFTDDGLMIFADGKSYNKSQMLELMQGYKLDSITYEPDYSVRMAAPDVATLIYRCTYTSSVGGGPTETMSVLSSNVYVRRGGKWWSFLYHETRLK